MIKEKWKREGGKWWKIEKKNKKGRRKMRNVSGKRTEKNLRTFFFLFTLGNYWNSFGVSKNGNFYREKAKIMPGKVKKWLCPLKNVTVTPMLKMLYSYLNTSRHFSWEYNIRTVQTTLNRASSNNTKKPTFTKVFQ